jgi:hypothetical protein
MKATRKPNLTNEKVKPPWTGPWLIHFFQRHHDDDLSESVPARAFLDDCPVSVEAKLVAIVKAVAEAPPPAFSGGGKWEVMHDDMKGFYEAALTAKTESISGCSAFSTATVNRSAWVGRALCSSVAVASRSERRSRRTTMQGYERSVQSF